MQPDDAKPVRQWVSDPEKEKAAYRAAIRAGFASAGLRTNGRTEMLTTTHALSALEADQIKKALLEAAATLPGAWHFCGDPDQLAESLIRAFARVDAATRPEASSAD